MKTAGISEIKNELKTLQASQLLELCLKLARAKKDNKELLGYLLFESGDIDGYVKQLKDEVDAGLASANRHNLFLLKKQLRKLISFLNKHLKYMSNKAAEAELWLNFCRSLQKHQLPYKRTMALSNLYDAQLKKINAAIATLHEDLQHDFKKQLADLL